MSVCFRQIAQNARFAPIAAAIALFLTPLGAEADADGDTIGFNLVILQSGDDVRAVSLSAGIGDSVTVTDGVLLDGSGIDETSMMETGGTPAQGVVIGTYSSVVVFGPQPE
jgi:hypothetical protein